MSPLTRLWCTAGLLCGCSGGESPPTPFTYRLEDRLGNVLLEMPFATYEASRGVGPFTVTVTEGGIATVLELQIGFCERITDQCTGPLALEQLVVTSDPFFEEHVFAYRCRGPRGGITGGIDVSKDGDCR